MGAASLFITPVMIASNAMKSAQKSARHYIRVEDV